MKKIGIILAIAIALTFVVGCASSGGSSSGGGGGGGAALKPYSVDLSTLSLVVPEPPKGTEAVLKGQYKTQKAVKNATPFVKKYDDLLILFPEQFPVDITQYSRITITCKYFDKSGAELDQADTRAMVSLIYDLKGDLRGPEMGPGKNTPLKEMNVGGFSGLVNTDRGVRVKLTQVPGGILFQNSDDMVKFIELTGITFHNKTASGE